MIPPSDAALDTGFQSPTRELRCAAVLHQAFVAVDVHGTSDEYLSKMTNDEIHSTIFRQRWRRCTLRLVNGETIAVVHPDYLFMPPARNWVLYVKPEGKGLQFVPTGHIAAIELEQEPVSSGSDA